jgi:hypothetical protein
MDAVRAADGRRVLVLDRAPLQRGEEGVEVGEQDVGSADELDVEAGVEDVRGRHALVHEARLRTDDFGEVGEEGDDVVLHLALDRVDALDVEHGRRALFPDDLGRLARDHAELGERARRMRLDLEPDAEPGLGRPERHHLRTAVAGDHRACLANEAAG